MQKLSVDLIDEVMAELDEIFGDKVWQILLVPLVASIMAGHFDPRYLRRNRKPADLLWLWIVWNRARRGEEGYEIVFGTPQTISLWGKSGKVTPEEEAAAIAENKARPKLIIEIIVPNEIKRPK